MAKMIAFDQEAREAIRRGVAKLVRAIKVTLGPKGRNVILENAFGSPTLTKDGVTVANEIDLENVYENMGARMVREVASKTSDLAGDGTTTATVMALVIFNEGLGAVVAGANPIHLKQGIERAVSDITAKLKDMSIRINSKTEMAQVASAAANNDTVIGELLASAFEKVGKDGVITVDEGKNLTTETEWVEGIQFDRGYLSPYFVTDSSTMEGVLEDCYILVYEKKITSIKDVVPLLEAVVNAGKPLLIIAEEVEGEALATLVVNRIRGTFQCAAVKAPAFGDRRKSILEDIAIVTGGQAVFEDAGIKLENVSLAELGRAKRVIVGTNTTTIIEGAGKSDDIKARIDQIRREIDNSTSDYEKEQLAERLTKLSGGIAKVNVGAATESEMMEKKALIEDALHATRAAVEEGVLPGGGVALLRAAASVNLPNRTDDEKTGYQIVLNACRVPLQYIAQNAGRDGDSIYHQVALSPGNFGYNAATDRIEDLVTAGILDPTKVVRTALQNAASVASLLLTSDAIIAEPSKIRARPIAYGSTSDLDEFEFEEPSSTSSFLPLEPERESHTQIPAMPRAVNAWLEGDEQPLQVARSYRVGVAIGPTGGEVDTTCLVGTGEAVVDAEHLDLSFVLYGEGTTVRPAVQSAELPPTIGMRAVYFDVMPCRVGTVEMRLAVFHRGDETLLHKSCFSLEVSSISEELEGSL